MTALPTIEEQATITKQDEDADQHKTIAEVFPEQKTQQEERRKRNTSESNASGKFQVTPVKASFSKRGAPPPTLGLPRNSTAPNFVDPTLVIPRNSSTPGFGHLAILNGSGHANETIYGIQVRDKGIFNSFHSFIEDQGRNRVPCS